MTNDIVCPTAPGRSHGAMPESAVQDKEQQDKGRADTDAILAPQVYTCMSETTTLMGLVIATLVGLFLVGHDVLGMSTVKALIDDNCDLRRLIMHISACCSGTSACHNCMLQMHAIVVQLHVITACYHCIL